MSVKDAPWVGRVEPIERTEISAAYWETDASAAELGVRFGFPANQASRKAGPCRFLNLACRVCGGEIVEACRMKTAGRLRDLARTYGWSRAKHDAQACVACWRGERDAAAMARWKAYRPAVAAQIAADSRRLTELASMPYADYLLTPEWHERRSRALKRAGYACQVCYSNEKLHVHHRTYARRGYETDADLTVLCAECHALFHERMKLAELRQPAGAAA